MNRLTGEVNYDKFRRLGFLLGIPESIILSTYLPQSLVNMNNSSTLLLLLQRDFGTTS